MSGKTILSCGHEDEHGCMGVSVQFDDEECVAGEGFVPTTVYAQYCHECATKLYYEIGKDTGRVEAGLDADRIEALTAEVQAWRECALYDATMEGPVFKGWDRSALERCRRAALTGDDT